MTPPYEKLRAWTASHALVLAVYKATDGWPAQERYGLTAQARRAAVSIVANIAEGVVKRGQREFRRFLNASLGSLGELQYLLLLARDLALLTQKQWGDLEELRASSGRLTWRLYESVLKRAGT